MTGFSRIAPFVVTALVGLSLLLIMLPHGSPAGALNLSDFGKLPVVANGRVQPLDTVARTSLMVISNRQDFDDGKRGSQPAIKWLLDMLTSGELGMSGPAGKYKVFRIDNEQLLNMLALEYRPGSYRYSMEEIAPKLDELSKQGQRLENLDPKEYDLFDAKVAELYKHLNLYARLTHFREPLSVPPADGGDEWKSLIHAAAEARDGDQPINPALRHWAEMITVYSKGEVGDFNRTLAEYEAYLREQRPQDVRNARLEVLFNHAAPFYYSMCLYVVIFLLAVASWIVFRDTLNLTALCLLVLTFLLHFGGILFRMYLMGRPPITNLYSTAVFIGCFAVLIGIVLELIFRISIGNLIGAVLGGLTALIGHHLAGTGDTMEMMEAVLDTNFWLATHVVIINIGYATTMFAGFLGIAYLLLGVGTRQLTVDLSRTLHQMIYAVLCFATLFSFTGTVLGGIWADQSWGRFWGWDPKENGALLIVLWNALILHARWAGLVKQRGVAVLAVAGNMVTAWSWFGTNQLGVGLHAYGFNSELATGLTIFWATQLVLIAVGLIPLKHWSSYAILTAPPPKQEPRPRVRVNSTAVIATK